MARPSSPQLASEEMAGGWPTSLWAGGRSDRQLCDSTLDLRHDEEPSFRVLLGLAHSARPCEACARLLPPAPQLSPLRGSSSGLLVLPVLVTETAHEGRPHPLQTVLYLNAASMSCSVADGSFLHTRHGLHQTFQCTLPLIFLAMPHSAAKTAMGLSPWKVKLKTKTERPDLEF